MSNNIGTEFVGRNISFCNVVTRAQYGFTALIRWRNVAPRVVRHRKKARKMGKSECFRADRYFLSTSDYNVLIAMFERFPESDSNEIKLLRLSSLHHHFVTER